MIHLIKQDSLKRNLLIWIVKIIFYIDLLNLIFSQYLVENNDKDEFG